MSDLENYNEKQLFQLISEGDEAAFNHLYDTVIINFSPYLYRMLQSHEAVKDVLQETLIRFWLNRNKLTEIEHPKAWLYRIASNECYRYLRKQVLRNELADKFAANQTTPEANELRQTETELSFRDTQQAISRAVAGLPTRQQAIYKLSREQGLNPHEIASQLGVSYNYVRKTLLVALRAIQEILIKEGRFLPMAILLLF